MKKLNDSGILKYNGINYLVPFVIVTTCFALWGFANDITPPMVKAFSKIFRMSVTDGTLIQVAFYGGYFAMAFPAAIFIKKYSYKTGILLGLSLYAIGALLFFPAKGIGLYYPFLIAYFIMTCGLSFLETSANPFIMQMGAPETATRRLNMAQAFNPLGALSGLLVAKYCIQANLNEMPTAERMHLEDNEFEALKQADLNVLVQPYLYIVITLALLFIILKFTKIPKLCNDTPLPGGEGIIASLKRLSHNHVYMWSVVAQFFYVGVQTMCWTFIIQYGTHYFMLDGMTEKTAESEALTIQIFAIMFFILGRFICTYLMKFVQPSKLLLFFASLATILTLCVILMQNSIGVYCLALISLCMSLMFPTIYGIGLKNVGHDAEFGAAGLIMSILGGSVLPIIQANIIDCGTIASMPAINISFIMPLICFLVITIYSLGCIKKHI